MHITVAGKQVETGEALKTHVRDGLGTIAKKYFDHAMEANVTFRRDAKGHAFVCDINLKAGRNLFMRGNGLNRQKLLLRLTLSVLPDNR